MSQSKSGGRYFCCLLGLECPKQAFAKIATPIPLIIVNWNSWDILSHCLEKLQGQTFRDFNVLVIDNASDQPTPPELCSRYSNVTLPLHLLLNLVTIVVFYSSVDKVE